MEAKNSIFYIGCSDKIYNIMDQIKKDDLNIVRLKEIDKEILNDFPIISLFIIDIETWTFEYHQIFIQLCSLNPLIKFALIFDSKSEFNSEINFYNEFYDRLLLNHIDIEFDLLKVFIDYDLTELSSEEYLTVNNLSLDAVSEIPLYAHCISDTELLIKKPIFSNEIIEQGNFFHFKQLGLKFFIDNEKYLIKENQDYFQISGDFQESAARIENLGYLKLPFINLCFVAFNTNEILKHINLVNRNYVFLDTNEKLVLNLNTSIYIINAANFKEEEIKTFSFQLKEDQFIILMNTPNGWNEIREHASQVKMLIYKNEIEYTQLESLIDIYTDKVKIDYSFFQKNDTLKIGETKVDVKIIAINENFITIEKPYQLSMGTMVKFDFNDIQFVGYLTQIESSQGIFQLTFSTVFMGEDETNQFRRFIHSVHYCVENGVEPKSIKSNKDIELKLALIQKEREH